MGRCELMKDCPHPANQVVVTTNGWVVDCCECCAVAACDHIHASMSSDDLSTFMQEQTRESAEYREALSALISADHVSGEG